jgi:hypothetical protein
VKGDLYLTIASVPDKGGRWTFAVVEQPLVMWLWVGAGLIGFGSVLSAIPGRRRRPTDPVSRPATTVPPPATMSGQDDDIDVDVTTGTDDPLPVGAGEQQ